MIRTGGRSALVTAAVLAVGGLALGPAGPAAADADTAHTYVDGAYSTQYVQPATPDPQNKLRPLPPTRDPGQNKLWFYAGAWWALMLEPTGHTTRVFELMPDHSWRPTSAVVNANTGSVGDALPDGNAVHVATRGPDGSLYYVRLTFDAATGQYQANAPVLVTPRNSLAPAMIGKSAIGTLWVGYVTTSNVIVIPSVDGGVTWGSVLTLASTPSNQVAQSGALVTFNQDVGILWSDQSAHTFDFAYHRNGDDLGTWSREQIQTQASQDKSSISLVRVPGTGGDSLAAAVTTVSSVQTKPLGVPPVQVLVRTPDGHWSAQPIATENDALADPVLQVDEGTQVLRLFGAHNSSIVSTQASLTDLRFPQGIGSLFMNGASGNLATPTVSRDPVDAASGLVVLACDLTANAYRHAELPIAGATPAATPGDTTPPASPTGLHARAVSSSTVVLSWTAAVDATRWAPAQQGVPASRYVVQRNGATLTTVTDTSVQDTLKGGTGGTVTYQVQAVDAAGNRSAPASITVQLPATPTPPPLYLIVGLIVLAVLAAAYALQRRWAARRVAQRDVLGSSTDEPPQSPVQELTPSGRN